MASKKSIVMGSAVAFATAGAIQFSDVIVDTVVACGGLPAACIAAAAGIGGYLIYKSTQPETYELVEPDEIDDPVGYFVKGGRCPDHDKGLAMQSNALQRCVELGISCEHLFEEMEEGLEKDCALMYLYSKTHDESVWEKVSNKDWFLLAKQQCG